MKAQAPSFEQWFRKLMPKDGEIRELKIRVDGSVEGVAIKVFDANGDDATAQQRIEAALFVVMAFTGTRYPFIDGIARDTCRELMKLWGAVDGTQQAASVATN